MNHLLFEWFNSSVDASFNIVEDTKKKKASCNKSKLKKLVNQLYSFRKDATITLERPHHLNNLHEWRLNMREFSSTCFDNASLAFCEARIMKPRTKVTFTSLSKFMKAYFDKHAITIEDVA